MPSRVASSLVASLKSHANSLITHTVQEYEEVVVRLCQSTTLRQAMKLSIASRLLSASTFNKVSMQISLEQSYQQVWEVRNVMKIHQRALEDQKESYHRLLPHIIGETLRHDHVDGEGNERDEMFIRGMQLIQLLTCYGNKVHGPTGTVLLLLNETKLRYQQELENLIRDSDSEAISDLRTSIRSIRHRLILGGIEQVSRRKRLRGRVWDETLYDPCVYHYNCSMCLSSPIVTHENLSTKTQSFSSSSSLITSPVDRSTQIKQAVLLSLHTEHGFNVSNYLHNEQDQVIFTQFLSYLKDSTTLLHLFQTFTNFLDYLLRTRSHISSLTSPHKHHQNHDDLVRHLFQLITPLIFSQQTLVKQQVEIESLLRYLPKSSSSDQMKREAMREILTLIINSPSEKMSWNSNFVYFPLEDVTRDEGTLFQLALILESQIQVLGIVGR
jgi:hypothetical protein